MSLRAGALAATTGAALLFVPGSAQAVPSPGSALGFASTVVRVDSVVRQDDGLRVTLTLTNPTERHLSLSRLTPLGAPQGFSGVGVVDPATGQYGALFLGDECRCAQLPVFLRGGEAVTFPVVVADPGGERVDVVFAAYQPITGVEVDGDGDASADSGVTELRPRALSPVGRTRQGAVSVAGKQVALDTDVLFAFGSAALTPAGGQALDRAAVVLRAQPERSVSVEGHTDSKGETALNQRLSEQRASTVRDALAARLGGGWTFSERGYGETRPVAPETAQDGAPYPEGQASNRRVELRVSG